MNESESRSIKNLTSRKVGDNIIITPNENARLFLSYIREKINMLNEKDRKEFIVCTESIIRKSNDYKAYIAELKERIPATHTCALYNNITDDKAVIEMHHGPIFTLAEIVNIVLNHYIKNNKDINSFHIADEILEDHFDNMIQVVFLSKAAHKVVSQKKLSKDTHIHIDKAIGDLVKFITKYNDVITYYEINKLRNYLYMCDLYEKNKGSNIYTIMKERVKSFKDAKPE